MSEKSLHLQGIKDPDAPNPRPVFDLGPLPDEDRMRGIVDPDAVSYRRDAQICAALGISEEDWEELGNQGKRIISLVLPAFAQKFVEANKHYGPGNANVLGPAGQFADIWRKIGPLRRSLWDGRELTREQPEEICLDLIGHLLLTVDMLREGVDRRGTSHS